MSILNLTTFLRVCKTRLVYYKQSEYHIFTNGVVLYACKDDNPNLPKLLDSVITNSTGLNNSTFEPIIEALNNEPRAYIVDHVKKANTTKVITDFDETKGVTIEIANSYLKTIKRNIPKNFFLITIPFTLKGVSCYFAKSLIQDEFILIMPIIKK